jgi:hypothetical protein
VRLFEHPLDLIFGSSTLDGRLADRIAAGVWMGAAGFEPATSRV